MKKGEFTIGKLITILLVLVVLVVVYLFLFKSGSMWNYFRELPTYGDSNEDKEITGEGGGSSCNRIAVIENGEIKDCGSSSTCEKVSKGVTLEDSHIYQKVSTWYLIPKKELIGVIENDKIEIYLWLDGKLVSDIYDKIEDSKYLDVTFLSELNGAEYRQEIGDICKNEQKSTSA